MSYNTNNEMDCAITESPRQRYEQAFVYVICDLIISALNIQWKDRNVVRELMFAILKDKLCKRQGLLEQYLHSQLDILKDTFISAFDLNKDIKINYDYATHAKFNDIIKAIKNLLPKK